MSTATATNNTEILVYGKALKKQKPMYTCDHTLVIVESPSKCPIIHNILSNDGCTAGGIIYKVIATQGHFYQLSGYGKNFEPKYSIIAGKGKIVDELKIQIGIARNVIIATDADREGEAIAYHICRASGLDLNTTRRIVFSEITSFAILNAINNPQIINMNLVLAQQTRTILDLMVGYKISPLLWKYVGGGTNTDFGTTKNITLSAGRCQTPALRLIHDDEIFRKKCAEEISTNVQKYRIFGNFFTQKFPFELIIGDKNMDNMNIDNVRSFLKESSNFSHSITKVKQSICSYSPPLPFNTCSLIQAASNHLSISPKDTMDICQLLYQNGHITYARTDSCIFSSIFHEQVNCYIKQRYNQCISNPDVPMSDSSLKSFLPHEAIRPTSLNTLELSSTKFSSKEKALYKLIYQHSIEACMNTAVYNVLEISISAPQSMEYIYSIEYPKIIGWKIVQTTSAKIALLQKTWNSLNILAVKGKVVKYNLIEASIFPNVNGLCLHYSEAGLVKTLQQNSIGRPSTFSSIIDIIQQRGYTTKKNNIEGKLVQCFDLKLLEEGSIEEKQVDKIFGNEKNKLVITKLGERTIDFLIKYFNTLFSYSFTAEMETHLDLIANGSEDWIIVCNRCQESINKSMEFLKQDGEQKFPLDETHEVIFLKNGPIIKQTLIIHENEDDDEDDICGDIRRAEGTASSSVKKFKTKLKTIDSNIHLDLIKLGQGGYKLEELLALSNYSLGDYEGHPLYLKKGKFGLYIEWGEDGQNKTSIKNIQIPPDEITLSDIVTFLTTPAPNEPGKEKNGICRIVCSYMSIRIGKYGPYIFYQTIQMKKPKIISLKKFQHAYMTCDVAILEQFINQQNNR